MMDSYIVFWTRPGYRMAFQGDIHAPSPRQAREYFLAIWPEDLIVGVKRTAGGPWLA